MGEKLIGGMFGLETYLPSKNQSVPPFLSNHNLLLANARSGISLLIEHLAPPHVWVPSYLCDSMLDAIGNHITEIKFYEMDGGLQIFSSDWFANICREDLVIFIDYFGFPTNSHWIANAKKRGAWVLEDASQALLSQSAGQNADFVLYSPRKFLGVPDGGILSSNCETNFENIPLQNLPLEWWLKALTASVLRREFDTFGGDRRWFALFQEVESQCPIGHFAMSDLSKEVLRHADYPSISSKRIRNYHLLTGLLKEIALIPKLPPLVVPIGFPIRLKNRDDIRDMLFEHQIYPPIHWTIENIVPCKFIESHKLSKEIMTLPCDQRYDENDMTRMANIVLSGVKQ